MMKKFLAALAILLISCSVRVCAAAPLIDANVEEVIQAMNYLSRELNIRLWGKEYYTYKGLRRCELHWGNSSDNLIRFRLDSNNNVQRALVSFNSKTNVIESALMYSSILMMADLTEADIESFSDKFMQDVMAVFKEKMSQNSAAGAGDSFFHKAYKIWSSEARRNIIVDVEMNNNGIMDIYMYAE